MLSICHRLWLSYPTCPQITYDREIVLLLLLIDPTKLLRGAVLALAIGVAAPLAGVSAPLVGIEAAQAQSPVVATVLFEGNQRFTDAQLLAMIDTTSRGAYTTDTVDRDAESIRLDGGIRMAPR